MSDVKEQKQAYRDHARDHRNRIERDETDFETIIDIFFEYFKPSKDEVIALYWPAGKEFDTRFLLDELVNQGYQCALPVATEGSRVMTFKKWTHDTEMTKGVWGVHEPQDAEEVKPDVIIAPLLAFDQKGYRLGQGGGHYDSTIENLRQNKEITYIGVGYAEQAVLFKLPTEDHDIPLDYVMTPKGVTDFKDVRGPHADAYEGN